MRGESNRNLAGICDSCEQMLRENGYITEVISKFRMAECSICRKRAPVRVVEYRKKSAAGGGDRKPARDPQSR